MSIGHSLNGDGFYVISAIVAHRGGSEQSFPKVGDHQYCGARTHQRYPGKRHTRRYSRARDCHAQNRTSAYYENGCDGHEHGNDHLNVQNPRGD